MASLNLRLRSLFLAEFVSAFFLALRRFFAPKKTIDYPFEKGHCRRASAASTRCGAIPTVRNDASPPAGGAPRRADRRADSRSWCLQHRRDIPGFPRRQHIGPDRLGRLPERIVEEVSVALGRLDLRMAEYLADQGQRREGSPATFSS